MAATNPRYERVPTQDTYHDDEETPAYTQAPPAYQAEPAVGEAPRTEDDNVPDDFKFGGSVAEASLPIRMQFIRKVYAILTVQLLFTTALSAVSFWSKSYKSWIQSNQWMMWVSLFGAIGFMLYVGGHAMKYGIFGWANAATGSPSGRESHTP